MVLIAKKNFHNHHIYTDSGLARIRRYNVGRYQLFNYLGTLEPVTQERTLQKHVAVRVSTGGGAGDTALFRDLSLTGNGSGSKPRPHLPDRVLTAPDHRAAAESRPRIFRIV